MPLSPSQLSELLKKLTGRRDALLEEIRDELEQSQNQQYVELLDRVPADVGDKSVADLLADFNLAIIDRHIRELRDIDLARARAGDRSFGICVTCGDAIAFERLSAYPTAERCVRCQQQRERVYAHEAMPKL